MKATATYVIDLVGGHKVAAEIAGIDVSQVYRWVYPREQGGCGDHMPARHQPKFLKWAAENGKSADLSPMDFFDIPTPAPTTAEVAA